MPQCIPWQHILSQSKANSFTLPLTGARARPAVDPYPDFEKYLDHVFGNDSPRPMENDNGNSSKSGRFNLQSFGTTAQNLLSRAPNKLIDGASWLALKIIFRIYRLFPRPLAVVGGPRNVFLCCRRLIDKQAVYGPISVVGSHDQDFFRHMGRAYRTLRGKFGWISLRAVARFRFVKFQPFYQTQVSCSETDQIPTPDHQEYEIDYPTGYIPGSLPFEPPIPPDVMLYFYQYPGCASLTEKYLKFIPKRIVGNPDPPDEAWGLYAEEGLCVWKFWLMMLAIMIGSIAFMVPWLIYHPGDLQNAFTPPMFAVAVVGVLLVAPEFVGYHTKKKQN
ncbi:hypothetical protein TWF730_003371 [Orbilia blumenaviensis]|uniref:Uncharacterized protein n=1 Tax=Orbilia blumenaviensis TaxID=1796055 RepID=A0AAV9U961_9PEZI